MWNYLHLEQFKVFDKLSLPLAPLTMLSGFNAAGKSTCLQALALLHQTARENEWTNNLLLNGSSVSLGTVADVINKQQGRRHFSIGLSTDNAQATWKMHCDDRRASVAHIEEVVTELDASRETNLGKRGLRRLLPSGNGAYNDIFSNPLYDLSYISAERIGPRETYAVTTPHQQHSVGAQGQWTAWYLNEFGENEVRAPLRLKEEPNPLLARQASAWLGHFFPGASFDVGTVANANLVTLSFRTRNNGDSYRPQNVGYGLTHILPILATALGSERGSVFILENPEAHLHPAGQAQIGQFLARVAATGVQVIFETHSDHVLNGVRRAVKDGVIPPGDVATHFFAKTSDEEELTQVQSVHMDGDGNLDDWPEGFFDQFDKDTSYFTGW